MPKLEFFREICELADSGKYGKAELACWNKVVEDPWDTSSQDLMIQLYIDYLEKNSNDPKTRLELTSKALRFGRQIADLSPYYFQTLSDYLKNKPKLESPGQLVIGLGPGRNGSTSLSSLLGTAENSLCTHEVYPLIYAEPTKDQVEFHCRRYSILRQYYSMVSDTSHWHLYAARYYLTRFPEMKFIVLIRDSEKIVASFEKVKRRENHWAKHDGNFWTKSFWDFCYPSFEADKTLDKLQQRRSHLTQYVSDYYSQCQSIPSTNKLTISVDDLNHDGFRQIGRFLNLTLSDKPIHKNAGGTADSLSQQRVEF